MKDIDAYCKKVIEPLEQIYKEMLRQYYQKQFPTKKEYAKVKEVEEKLYRSYLKLEEFLKKYANV